MGASTSNGQAKGEVTFWSRAMLPSLDMSALFMQRHQRERGAHPTSGIPPQSMEHRFICWP